MKLSRIQISNFMGIEEIDISAGDVTVIEGGNGQGKTSILRAIQNVMEGGRDATLIRNGAQEAQVILLFDDGTEVNKRIRNDADPLLSIKNGDGKKMRKNELDRLIDLLSFNPVEILKMSAKEQAAAILQSLPLQLDVAALSEATGGRDWSKMDASNAVNALDVAYKTIYEERVPVNVDIDRCTRTIQQLQQTLPPEDESTEDPRPALVSQREELRVQVRTLEQTAQNAKAQKLAKITEEFAQRTASLDERITELKAELAKLESERRAVAIEKANTVEKLDQAVAANLASRSAELKAALAGLNAQIESADRQDEQMQRYKLTRAQIASARDQQVEQEGVAKTLTGYLKAIERMKAELLGKLPIKGLTVENGAILLGGVPFDKVNDAGKIKFLLQVAKLRAGELPLVLLDGLEKLDASTWPLFEESAKKSGLQMVVTRVTEGAMKVRLA